jgi:hypothetical protein
VPLLPGGLGFGHSSTGTTAIRRETTWSLLGIVCYDPFGISWKERDAITMIENLLSQHIDVCQEKKSIYRNFFANPVISLIQYEERR